MAEVRFASSFATHLRVLLFFPNFSMRHHESKTLKLLTQLWKFFKWSYRWLDRKSTDKRYGRQTRITPGAWMDFSVSLLFAVFGTLFLVM